MNKHLSLLSLTRILHVWLWKFSHFRDVYDLCRCCSRLDVVCLIAHLILLTCNPHASSPLECVPFVIILFFSVFFSVCMCVGLVWSCKVVAVPGGVSSNHLTCEGLIPVQVFVFSPHSLTQTHMRNWTRFSLRLNFNTRLLVTDYYPVLPFTQHLCLQLYFHTHYKKTGLSRGCLLLSL